MSSEEKLFLRGKQHPVVFFWPTILFVASGLAYIRYPAFVEVFLAGAVISIIWFLLNLVTFLVTSIEVTNYRITFKSGLFIRRMKDFQINRIEGVKVRQSLLGEFLGYGTLIIIGTGGTRSTFPVVANPKIIRQQISKRIHDVQRRD